MTLYDKLHSFRRESGHWSCSDQSEECVKQNRHDNVNLIKTFSAVLSVTTSDVEINFPFVSCCEESWFTFWVYHIAKEERGWTQEQSSVCEMRFCYSGFAPRAACYADRKNGSDQMWSHLRVEETLKEFHFSLGERHPCVNLSRIETIQESGRGTVLVGLTNISVLFLQMTTAWAGRAAARARRAGTAGTSWRPQREACTTRSSSTRTRPLSPPWRRSSWTFRDFSKSLRRTPVTGRGRSTTRKVRALSLFPEGNSYVMNHQWSIGMSPGRLDVVRRGIQQTLWSLSNNEAEMWSLQVQIQNNTKKCHGKAL